MALADYSTAAEKIAALKAATLDPALVQVKMTSDDPYTTTEDIHVFYANNLQTPSPISWDIEIVDTGADAPSTSNELNQTFESGIQLINFDTMLFVKDSDIVYADPVATYQKRLLTCFNTAGTAVHSADPFTTGATGVILVNSPSLHNSEDTNFTVNPPVPFLPYPPGLVLIPKLSFIRYFDVPADW